MGMSMLAIDEALHHSGGDFRSPRYTRIGRFGLVALRWHPHHGADDLLATRLRDIKHILPERSCFVAANSVDRHKPELAVNPSSRG
jgi:hypothetical protein